MSSKGNCTLIVITFIVIGYIILQASQYWGDRVQQFVVRKFDGRV